MRWYAVALIVGCVVLAGAVTAAFYVRDADKRRGQDVRERLDRMVRTERVVRITDLADFDFDRMVAVPGRALPNEVDQLLGFKWRRSDDLGWSSGDPGPIWVFTNGNSVVAYTRLDQREAYGQCADELRYRPSDRIDLVECRP